ncbi:helix-turn-helix transcriptional regulator [Lentibacter algarum]|uniref:helix-turn-helix transcriptional regulator n=1 Tax=Lentibacter algarum TaxID=576131 RepID=UPI00339D762B
MLKALERTTELPQLQLISEQLRDYFEVDHIVYHWVSGSGTQYGCGTYDDAWVQRYVDQDYLRVDPVVLGCFQRFTAVDWKKLNWTSKAARGFLEDAQAHGVGNQGFSVPVHGPNGQFALFSVNHDSDDDTWFEFIENNRRNLILVAHYFNEKALEFEPDRAPEATAALSPREVDAMTFLAMGYSRAQVADTLSISEHTLRVYIESARHKLGAANTTHAVARALQNGLIVI